jgi:dipeptidyl aminopeptidase/acylaminoacyl peptidase
MHRKRLFHGGKLTSALFLLCFTHLIAQAGGMTLEQVGEIRSVGQIAVAPDGERIAFTVNVPLDPYQQVGAGRRELHVARSVDDIKPYVYTITELSSLAWRPPGDSLAFLAMCQDTGHRVLYEIPIDGGEPRRILVHDADITAYSFSPDGRFVAFLATEAVSAKDRKLAELGFNARVWEESVRPQRVWIADTLGEVETRLLETTGSASSLSWSPDGEHLAFMLAPTALTDDDLMHRQLVVASADQGKITHRFNHQGKKGDAVWAPDGQRLAFIGGVDIHDPRQGRLMIAELAEGFFRDITLGYLGHVQDFAWKDAEHLFYIGHVGAHSELARIDFRGRHQEVIRSVPRPLLRAIDHAGGTLAMIADSPHHPAELYVMEDDRPVRWTDSNPWLANVRLARQEVITYTARDGLELEGILVHPLDPRGGPVPTIFAIHGGPEAHDSDGWLTSYARPAQVAAARGYAMFFPNYRGSTGRGLAFSKLGQGEPAGAEFNDILDARNQLIEVGVAAKGRIGITGRSYGGYAAAWAATAHSQYFDASVVGAGAGENLSKFGTSDITHELYLAHLQEWPWENWQMYLESSPIYHAERSRTPTLILHGEQDARVHVSQGLILYRYLKLAGQAPVRLVTYPDEAHATSHAAARRDYSMRLMRWMDHFLLEGADEPPPYRLDHSPWVNTADGGP